MQAQENRGGRAARLMVTSRIMSSPQPADTAFEALNDNELEILRLLASGHTAKSIAANLGRSETAINERLRDARRKTGVGSSRELARLLDARKIWDKNIDLAGREPSGDIPLQPRPTGPEWTKGRIVMMTAISAALLGLAALAWTTSPAADTAAQAPAATAKASPLAGRWSLDVSRIPETERPQSVTIAFSRQSDGQWTTYVELVDAGGVRRFAKSTARADGVAVPVSGTMDFIDTASLRQPEANTLVMTLGKAGKPVSTRVYTVSRDGKSMTETIVWPGSDIPGLETTHFSRIG